MTSKFFLIAQREYLTRVRKKSFIVLTLIVPLLLATFGFIIAKVASSDNDSTDVVEVRDDSGLNVAGRLASTPQLRFETAVGTLAEAKKAGVGTINYGLFLNALINFLIIAFIIFMIVKAANRIRKAPVEVVAVPAPPTTDQQLLMDIRDALRTGRA